MACTRPRPAWRTKQPNENGRYPITFSKKGTQLDEDFMIPCGKCEACASAKAKEWAVRIYHESTLQEQNAFVTLTYRNAPPEINRRDPQLFIKGLRRHFGKHRIRYFLTGEYGEKTRRPHYHAIIFGSDFLGASYNIDDRLYGNPIVDSIWGRGNVQIGTVTPQSCSYVAGYVNKKIGDNDTFSIMSRFPPIGYEWARQNKETIARTESVVIQGKEFPVPKKYLEWSEPSKYRDEPIELDTVRGNRGRHVKHYTPAEQRNREKNAEAKQKLKDQKL